jgi:4-hydroxy-3-polyprenylbenzoate decarboxylase
VDETVMLKSVALSSFVWETLRQAGIPEVRGVWQHEGGCGQRFLVISIKQRYPGHSRQALHVASACRAGGYNGKWVVVVDDDIDPSNISQVLWAMTTRYQGDRSTAFIPDVRCHPLDPSQSPDFSPFLSANGTSCKTIFDCTVPYALKERFRRPAFADVDVRRWFPNGLPPGPQL